MLGWAACGAAGALLAPAIRGRVPLAALCAVLGFAFSAEHGSLALVRVLPAHAGPRWQRCSPAGSGSTSHMRSATSRSRSRSAPSCAACSTATRRACGRWSCGPSRAPRRGDARRRRRSQFVQAHADARRVRRARRPARRAAHVLGGARPTRVAQRRARLARLPAVAGSDAALDDRRVARRARRAVARRARRPRCSTGCARRAARAGRSAKASTRRAGPCSRSAARPRRRRAGCSRASRGRAAGRGRSAASPTRTTPPPRSRRFASPASAAQPVDACGARSCSRSRTATAASS